MNKGEIWLADITYLVSVGTKHKPSYIAKSIRRTYVVGREQSLWDVLKKRVKKFHKKEEIKPIKKIGVANYKV